MTTKPSGHDPSQDDSATPLDARERLEEQAAAERCAADEAKRSRRELSDATRSHQRGGGQSGARLQRERAADDASLEEERSRADRSRVREQERSEQAVSAEAERREDAERRSEDLLERLTTQVEEESELRRRALVELETITRATRDVLVFSDARRSIEASVRSIRQATQRLRGVLDEALPKT